MAIKQLYPTSRASLDLNFEGSNRLDPRISFTRASIGTYVDSSGIIQAAAADEPRFNYDPVTGESLGLLLEKSAINVRRSSNDFNNSTYWFQASQVTMTPGYPSPNGGTDAYLYKQIAPCSSNGSRWAPRPLAGSVPQGQYIYSFFCKLKDSATENTVGFKFSTNLYSYTPATSKTYLSIEFTFDSSGVPTSQSTEYGGYKHVGDGWYRVWMYVYSDSGLDGSYMSLSVGKEILAAPATYGSFYIYGVQLETTDTTGSEPTSYVPTTTSAVTRAADVATVSNANNVAYPSTNTLVQRPFGASAIGLPSLSITAGNTVKRISVYPGTLSQKQINAAAEKTDEFWRWRINATDGTFGLGSIYIGGPVTVDWGDGSALETISNGDNNTHTFAGGPGIYEVGFKGANLFYTKFFYDIPNAVKVVAIGPAPENIRFGPGLSLTNCSNLQSFDATVNTSLSTNMYYAFRLCSSLKSFPLLDTSSATNFLYTWSDCTSLTSFPELDTSNGADFSNAWRNCSSLTSFPLIDTAAGTNFSRAWESCSSLTSFPLINTSSGTDFTGAWNGCSNLTSFPLINTAAGTSFYQAWQNCNSLTSFPLINTAAGTSFRYTWTACSSLTSFPLIDTAAGTNFGFAWDNCSSLTDFPANFFDSWTGTPANTCFTSAWDRCSALTATSVENILNSIDTSGQSAPASGVDITIDYNAGTGTPNITTAVTNLKSRGWTITLNGVLQ